MYTMFFSNRILIYSLLLSELSTEIDVVTKGVATGGALHNTTCETKKTTFSKLRHKNGSKFYQFFFMSRYTQYLFHTKNSEPNLMIFFSETYYL